MRCCLFYYLFIIFIFVWEEPKQHCTRHTNVMRGRGGLAPVRIEREQNNFDIRQHVVYMFIRYIKIYLGNRGSRYINIHMNRYASRSAAKLR